MVRLREKRPPPPPHPGVCSSCQHHFTLHTHEGCQAGVGRDSWVTGPCECMVTRHAIESRYRLFLQLRAALPMGG